MAINTDDAARDRIWDQLYQQIRLHFARHWTENAVGEGDFWVVDDNYGWRRHYVYIFNLSLITQLNIIALKRMLANFPAWEIIVVVDVVEKEGVWPPMGVTIRRDEIIDGLRREYLPPTFRDFVIPGSRPGTGYD